MDIDLREYFENTEGLGVLATADATGNVDLAVYGRPHVMDDGTVAFIMADRTSHTNLMSNPHAAYLFAEQGPGYPGKRLYLTKTGEETDPDRIKALRREGRKHRECDDSHRFLVHFKVDKVRPAVGN